MGILDNVTSAVNRGTESASRATEKIKLKSQIGELTKRRQQLAAQLGASLYEATKDNPELRQGREGLYDAIAACDKEREDCQARINEIDAMSQAATVAASSFRCAVCGATMGGTDLFCSGCGTPAAQARPSASIVTGISCVKCGAPMNAEDLFCMTCGAKVEPAASVQVIETVIENPESA